MGLKWTVCGLIGKIDVNWMGAANNFLSVNGFTKYFFVIYILITLLRIDELNLISIVFFNFWNKYFVVELLFTTGSIIF